MALTYQDYLSHLKDSNISPRFKIEFLYPDETVFSEISQDVLDDNGSLAINYTQGCRRSCNLTLYNADKRYLPTEDSPLWIGRKFKLYLGININNEDFWNPDGNGVFVVSNPEVFNNFSDKKITITGLDKFSLLDGQLNGQIDSTYQIANGSNIYSAIKAILNFDNGNGYKIDTIEPILDSLHSNDTISYTIIKQPGETTLGEVLIELANSISCDIYYDSTGRLRVESGITDLASINRSSLWSYSTNKLEYLPNSIVYQYDKVFSVVKVIGDNINGNLATGIAENNNPFSPTRIAKIGRKTKVITDNNINTDALSLERSQYELKKISILQSLVKLQSTFMAHLDVDQCIDITDDYYNFKNQRFLIQSLNIPLTTKSNISIDASNIRDLPYYTT